jgi:hypothetical protein
VIVFDVFLNTGKQLKAVITRVDVNMIVFKDFQNLSIQTLSVARPFPYIDILISCFSRKFVQAELVY